MQCRVECDFIKLKKELRYKVLQTLTVVYENEGCGFNIKNYICLSK